MSCEAIRQDMLDVLYGESDAATSDRVRAHQEVCPGCREEMAALRRLRADLGRWELPASLRPTALRPARATVRAGLRAAAVVLLALGGALGLSGSELRYDQGRLAFRLGRGADELVLPRMLAAQEARHQKDIRALTASLGAPGAAPADVRGLVERMIEESEARQSAILRAGLEDLAQRADRQRRADLAQVSAGLSYLEGKTGLQMARTTELMGHVLQASQEK